MLVVRPVDPQALDLYLSGMQHLNRQTVPDVRRAVQLLDASIAADPSFARAHEALARTYSDRMWKVVTISPEEALPKMRDAASRAIELDPTLAYAHALLAQSRWGMEYEWVETEVSLSRALALEPMNVGVLEEFSWFLHCSGRTEEALELIERAVAVEPLSLITRTDFGWSLYHARLFRRAIDEANRMLQTDPDFARAYDLLASARWALGDPAAAHEAWRRYIELRGRPAWYLEAVDRGYEQGGFKGARRNALEAIREHDDGSISHGARANLACMAEAPEEALIELNHAVRRRDPLILSLATWPTIDCVRSDPRYEELLRKINWPGLEE